VDCPQRSRDRAAHVQLAEVIGAMVVTTARYEDVTDTVCLQVRQQRAAAKERGERGRG
jgi:hypothetical protein